MNALTEMKVTAAPGPYDITGSAYITANGIGHVYIVDKNRRKIAAVWGSSQEKLATADLLAAAPDLLERAHCAYALIPRSSTWPG